MSIETTRLQNGHFFPTLVADTKSPPDRTGHARTPLTVAWTVARFTWPGRDRGMDHVAGLRPPIR